MGLDVYLVKYEDKIATKKLTSKYEKESDKIWKEIGDGNKYVDMTQEQKDFASKKCKDVAKKLGLDEYGSPKKNVMEYIELPSKLFPEHLCKIGYFRSSYNSGGLNSVLRDYLDKDLYDVFPHKDSSYEFQPDWMKSLQTVREVIKEFQDKITEVGGCEIIEVGKPYAMAGISIPQNKREALGAYKKELETHTKENGFGGSYSSGRGEFFLLEPLKVKAFINGQKRNILSGKIEDCVYAVYEGDMDWYIQALRVVEETCEWVLKQKDQDKYWLHWSG